MPAMAKSPLPEFVDTTAEGKLTKDAMHRRVPLGKGKGTTSDQAQAGPSSLLDE